MTTVHRESTYAASAEEMRGRVGGFYEIGAWLPGVTVAPLPDERRRRIALPDGGAVLEELVDESADGYRYRILDAPLPVVDYEAWLRVEADGEGSRVLWTAEFTAAGATPVQAGEIIGGILDSGLAALGG
jgi:polyketide cyclase/dehydrase/lipid transport protein